MRVRTRSLVACWTLLLSVASLAAAQDRRLADAVKNQDGPAVRALLKQKANVNSPQPDGATALHWAAHWDDLTTADLLLRAGAKVDTPNDYGVTPLFLAATNGSAAMIEKLLEARANPNAVLPTTGETPLMTAARTGKVDAVRTLLFAGADVNAKDTDAGQTALMWAAAESNVEVVRALTERGADVVHARSKAGFTPLMFAAREGDLETTKGLLAAGAKINDDAKDGTTALVVAVIRGHREYATFLLDHGADPNMGPGFTPLHWAAGEWQSGYTSATLGILEEDNQWFPLGGLRGQAKLDFVKVLLAHGADVNIRATANPRYQGGGGPIGGNMRGGNLAGGTPFLMAAQAGDVAVMRLLLANGADPKIKTIRNTTPLMAAAGLFATLNEYLRVTDESALEAIKLLLELGADVNAVNDDGATALHGTCYIQWGAVAKFLVEKGANMNVKDKNGWTPLTIAEGVYYAADLYASESLAELLRQLGAEPTPDNVERDSTVAAGRERQ
jgi:uncharacterized protein